MLIEINDPFEFVDSVYKGHEQTLKDRILDKIFTSQVDVKSISDGWHTFSELYYHRMVLFSLICNANADIAWKSEFHSDGTMFPGSFIVGLNTPDGQYTYHYKLEYWERFRVKELDKAPDYDGHRPKDIDRLFSIKTLSNTEDMEVVNGDS